MGQKGLGLSKHSGAEGEYRELGERHRGHGGGEAHQSGEGWVLVVGDAESIWEATKYRVVGNGEPNRTLAGERPGAGMAGVEHSWGAHLGRDGDSGQGCWGALAVLVWHAVWGQRRGTRGGSHLQWHKIDIWGQWEIWQKSSWGTVGMGLGGSGVTGDGLWDGEKGL